MSTNCTNRRVCVGMPYCVCFGWLVSSLAICLKLWGECAAMFRTCSCIAKARPVPQLHRRPGRRKACRGIERRVFHIKQDANQ